MGLFVYTVFGSIISVHSGIVFAVSCLVNRFLKHFFNAIL